MSAPLQFGILMHPFQTIDCIGPLDVLSSASEMYLKELVPFKLFDPSILDTALHCKYHFISDTMEPTEHTAGVRLTPSTTFEKCPKLDYLLVGGTDPMWEKDPKFPTFKKFVVERLPELKTLFATCTGGLHLAAMGVLDGKTATANHQVLPLAQQLYPKVKWTNEKQWVIDGDVWTAGGACAGMDMFAQWCVEKCGRDTAEAGWALLDYEPRDVNGNLIKREKYGLRLGQSTNGVKA